jgi:hypothetical protein
MIVLQTEEEMNYRRKYFNGKVEAGNNANSKPELCVMVTCTCRFCECSRSRSFIYMKVSNINVSLPTPQKVSQIFV